MNYIDFAIAISIFLFFFTMVLILSTNYFSSAASLSRISELRSISEGLFKLFFGSEGVPEDWENDPGLNPVQLGLMGDLYRDSVLVKENSGYDRTNELVSIDLIFDENCENKSWNNSVRVFDDDGNEIPFKISNESFCSNQFLKQAKVVWEANLTANQNKKFYVYYSSDDNILASNYTNTFSTVAYWSLDEGSGNYTFDDSGNDNTGHLENSTHGVPQWTTNCKYGSCLEFDGEGDYINIQDSDSLDIQEYLTIGMWIKLNIIGTTQFFVEKGLDDNDNYGFHMCYGDELSFEYHNGTGYNHYSTADGTPINLKPNIWYHVAVVFNKTHVKFYRNGSEVHVDEANGDLSTNNNQLLIGKQNIVSSPRYFNGTIDEVKIWNRALSPEEINASYISSPMPIRLFPEENLNVPSVSKINALKNLNYEEILKTLGDYKFRIEISEIK